MSDRAMTALAADDPRMVAWGKYRATDEYANARHWALKPDHVDGALWAAFIEGWIAAGRRSAGRAISTT